MKKTVNTICLLMLCFVLISIPAYPQIRETGTIHGYIHDEQGVALPGVTVKVSGLNLIGGEKTYISDSAGYYRFPTLPAGSYTVFVELSGFAKIVREIPHLSPNQSLTVDFILKQSIVNEAITVTANPPTIDVTSSSPGATVLSDTLLMALPSNKEYSEIMALGPGVQLIKTQTYTTISAYGRDGRDSGYQLDGISIPIRGWNDLSPDYNIIEEATVSGTGLSAEFGNFSGAILSAISKSGSNKFSGLTELRYAGRRWNSQNMESIPRETLQFPEDKDRIYELGSLFDLSFQFGGKIVRDQLWYFLSGNTTLTREYPLGTTGANKTTGWKGFGKLTYQLASSTRVNFAVSYDDQRAINDAAGRYYLPGATKDTTSPGALFDLNLTSTLSANSIFEAKFGYVHKTGYSEPRGGHDTAGHYDFVTNIQSVNAAYWEVFKVRQYHGSLHLSQFIPRSPLGAHDLKIGIEYVGGKPYDSLYGYTGGTAYYDWDGAPYLKEVYVPQSYTTSVRLGTYTAFIQDSWLVSRRMTLNLGLRYDYFRAKTPLNSSVLGMGIWAPRLGVAFDVFGDRKNVVKFNYGIYSDRLVAGLFSNIGQKTSGFDEYFWTGSDWAYSYSYRPGADYYKLDPNIKQPYLWEISGGYERELFRDASLSVNFFYRKLGRAIGQVNALAQWQPTTIFNPGIDGIEGTSDDLGTLDVYQRMNPDQDSALITNPSKGSYWVLDDPKFLAKGIEVRFSKRYSNRWQMNASYLYTRVLGNLDNPGSAYFYDPNVFVNGYGERGYLYGQPHQVKIQAQVLLPLDIDFGVSASLGSGITRGAFLFYRFPNYTYSQINILAPGETERNPFRGTIDVRVQKQIGIRGGKLSFMVDSFNILNSHTVVENFGQVDNTEYAYGTIASIMAPRSFRIGIRFTY
jgi:hypothetical protein